LVGASAARSRIGGAAKLPAEHAIGLTGEQAQRKGYEV
jgi:hypothetical protein